MLLYLRNIKHIFCVDIQLYQHEWKLEKRDTVWKHDGRRAECFHTISSFSNFHESSTKNFNRRVAGDFPC